MNKNFALLLVLLAVLVMGAVSNAAAAEIKASGQWQVDAQWANQWDFNKAAEDKTFDIIQRIRTQFQFIANENLKGVLETQIGPVSWGNGNLAIGSGRTPNVTTGTSGANVAGDGNIMLRKGYLDFKWPGTQVNFLVGFQNLSLPSAVGGGSPVLDDYFSAAATVVPISDTLSLVGGYARLYDAQAYGATSTVKGHGTSLDAAFLYANLGMIKGMTLTPWVAYANSGYNAAGAGTGATALAGFSGPNSSANEGLRGYWGGAAFTLSALDPFKVMADFNYGKATYNNQGAANPSKGGRSGFLFDLAVDYAGLSMMTPSAFFIYSSGEDGNSTQGSGKSERMPVIGTPDNYAVGSFWMQGGDAINANGIAAPNANMGFWALGLSLKDIKYIEKLSHTAHLIYFKGTNDPDYLKNGTGAAANNVTYGQFLTTKDSLWEVDFNTKYQIYEELFLALELGYINASLDKDTWGAVNSDYRTAGSKDAYKAALLLRYSF